MSMPPTITIAPIMTKRLILFFSLVCPYISESLELKYELLGVSLEGGIGGGVVEKLGNGGGVAFSFTIRDTSITAFATVQSLRSSCHTNVCL